MRVSLAPGSRRLRVGVEGDQSPARASRGAQVPGRRARRGCGVRRALHPRSADRRGARPPEHRPHPRVRLHRRHLLVPHAVHRRTDARRRAAPWTDVLSGRRRRDRRAGSRRARRHPRSRRGSSRPQAGQPGARRRGQALRHGLRHGQGGRPPGRHRHRCADWNAGLPCSGGVRRLADRRAGRSLRPRRHRVRDAERATAVCVGSGRSSRDGRRPRPAARSTGDRTAARRCAGRVVASRSLRPLAPACREAAAGALRRYVFNLALDAAGVPVPARVSLAVSF